MTNQSRNLGTPTNITRGSSGLQWKDANYTWAESGGTWDNPYDIGNQTRNLGTMTNQATP